LRASRLRPIGLALRVSRLRPIGLALRVSRGEGPTEGLVFGYQSQLREITVCAFNSSIGHEALISDEMTLVTYSSNETSLISVSPAAVRIMRKGPRKTCRSCRSQ